MKNEYGKEGRREKGEREKGLKGWAGERERASMNTNKPIPSVSVTR